MFSISCPGCSTKLTFEVKPSAGTHVHCPDCGAKSTFKASAKIKQPLSDTQLGNQQEERKDRSTEGPIRSPIVKKASSKLTSNKLKWILLGGSLTAVLICLIPTLITTYHSLTHFNEKPVGHKDSITKNGITIQPMGYISPLPNEGSKDGLSYKWREGPSKIYKFEINGMFTGRTISLDTLGGFKTFGCVSYETPKYQDISSFDEVAEFDKKSSGTGFVVHPEGVIATCAHVVFGAKSIQVDLDGKIYDAEVIAYKPVRDLALLKIHAKDLDFLPLAEKDQVELAQDIRVIGYPLSSALGESIKITRGAISGIGSGDQGPVLQVDATVNPGNSGGPVVDDQGRVVGVTNALLAGKNISNVGFAVPIDEIQEMMSKLEIPVGRLQNVEELNGPQLAKRVTPAVGFIKVHTGIEGFRFMKPKIVNFSGCSNTAVNTARGSASDINNEKSRMLVDAFGETHVHEGKHGLPFRLGILGKVGIETLSPEGESTWETVEYTIVTETKQIERSFLVSGSRTISGFGRRLKVPTTLRVYHLAIIRNSYEIISQLPKKATIKKRFSLKTIHPGQSVKPYLDITGEGEFEFDNYRGAPSESSMKYKISQTDQKSKKAKTMSVTMTYSEIDYGEYIEYQDKVLDEK